MRREKAKRLSVLLALCLVLAACGEGGNDSGTVAVSFEPGPCDFTLPDGQDPSHVECGYLTVPEDRAQANGRTIKLAVAVLKATGEHPVSDPVVMLSGGPGDPYVGSGMRRWTAEVAAPLQSKRDLVFFDQRGTGRSEPALQCPEYNATLLDDLSKPLTAEQDAANVRGAVRACHDRLVNEGVNLTAYTDAATAADIHDLMTALGYSLWNLRGISNGTRVALTALRDQPDGIRSVVLDSTVPVQANWRADYGKDFERSLNTGFAACAADPGCNAAFPDLERTFYDLVEQLNASPITVHPLDPVTSQPFDVVITGDRLLSGTQQALYDTSLIPLLPLVLTSTAGGDTALLTAAAANIAAPTANAQGVFRSDLCFEEVPFNTPDVIAAASDGVRAEIKKAGASLVNMDLDICAFWGANQPPALENEPVTSSVPALVLAGEYDPITPPAYGELAAETLSNSFYFLFAGQGHGQLFNPNAPDCAVNLVAAFLDDPTTRPDGSCVAALPPVHFVGS